MKAPVTPVEELLEAVALLRTELTDAEQKVDAIRARRLDLFRKIKAEHPSFPNTKIGVAAGMSDVGVINILRRADAAKKAPAKKASGG